METSCELEQKARDAFLDDDFDLAVSLYTQAMLAEPATASLFADRAQANIKLGNFPAAAMDATSATATDLDPTMHRAHLRKAYACIKLGWYEHARDAVEAGAALAPGDARFSKLMNEIDEKAPKAHIMPKETEASAAAAAMPAGKPKYRHD